MGADMRRHQTNQSMALAERNALVIALAEYGRKAKGAISPNTERALKADTAVFTAWCSDQAREVLPASPDTVADFIDSMAQVKATATVRRYVASIARMHRAAGLEDPTKDETAKLALKRMARANGVRQRHAAALNRPLVDRMIAAAGDGLRDKRDVALLSVQYDTLTRRSELVALDVEDIDLAEDGAGTVTIRRSKTDQEGEGSIRYLAHDTIEHLAVWLEAAEITEGALFRAVTMGDRVRGRLSDRDVSRRVKQMAKQAGLDIDPSGHSARVGVCQDMVASGFSLPEVMQAGGWKSPDMVARYSEHLQARNGAAAKLAAIQNR